MDKEYILVIMAIIGIAIGFATIEYGIVLLFGLLSPVVGAITALIIFGLDLIIVCSAIIGGIVED